ncbi:MAG: glycoside hydrolase family 38 C-terminal domain-containing protein [Planctomycetota bacterium]
MALTPEWRGRIEHWRNALLTLAYEPLGPVAMSGFTTHEQLTPREAQRQRFKPMPEGTAWGAKWEYAWFRGRVKLPAAARGRRIVLRAEPGGESRCLVNGREAGGIDGRHADILLAPAGWRGETRKKTAWPVYVGELYFQAHRGTYTTQARTKQGNRKSEFALRETELWGAVGSWLGRFRYPLERIDAAWKGVLLNQFHDILPGSSIERVYAEAEALYAQVLATAGEVKEAAARTLTRRAPKAVTVFNSMNWLRREIVPLPKGMAGAAMNGTPMPVQVVDGRACVEAAVPACGCVSFTAARPVRTASALSATTAGMENEHLRLKLNNRGEIVSLVDKASGMELAAAPLNQMRMYKDVPRWFDAWDIDSTYERTPVELPGRARVTLRAAGPLVAEIRVERTLNRSKLVQTIRLTRDSRRVDFVTRIDWREKHKLLKAAFPTTIHTNEAVHEVQFGHLTRPNHRSRPFDADRFEVANQKWSALAEAHRGFAVLNDCKYGLSTLGGEIALTLLRAPQAPDMRADQGVHEFTYALYAWNGTFWAGDVVREAYALNAPLWTMAGAAGTGSFLNVDAPNIIVETVKPAEDGSGDLVLRLYESKRAATACRLMLNLPVASAHATDMLDRRTGALVCTNGMIRLSFKPFEIKTIRLRRKKN